MSENQNKPSIKGRLQQIEEKLDSLTKTNWAKRLRITSGVFWNLFLLIIIFGITLTIFAASVGAGYFASLVAKEPLRSKDEMRSTIFSYEETSEIYAGDVYIGPVNADIARKEIKLEDVSPYVIDAVLATEDEYFETHDGIVPKAIFRGLFQDVTNADSQTGGSTLTQQLIKLQILTNEVSYERKAKEILLAMRLEHFMEKNEILEAYLNIIPYGRNSNGDNIAGIEAAAEGIFNLKAKDLNLAQSAYIAGIPQAPFAYTPFYNQSQGLKEDEGLKPGINRMKTVLFRMKETGYITEAEYNEALDYDIKKDFRKAPRRTNERYPYLTQEIQNRTEDVLAKVLAEEDGIDPERLDNESKLKEKYKILGRRAMTSGGYKIYSTIDLELYNRLKKIAEDYGDKLGPAIPETVTDKETGEKTEKDMPVQVGSMAIENSTGKILAFVGGRDFENESLNHATQAPREVGSSIKPLLVFGPAIEYGHIGAGSPVADVWYETLKYGRMASGKPYSPSNFITSEQMGVISARQALASSQNVATTRLYEQIIDKRPVEFLEKMGFSKIKPIHYDLLAVSLGTISATVEENTNAYATLANNGQFIDSYMIERIEDMEGNVVFQHETEPVEVFSPQTAYIITDMLRDVLTNRRGTAQIMKQNLNFNIDLAAKTGTSDDFGDAWLVGYNPNVTLGVWIGYKYRKHSLELGKNKYGPPSARVNKLYANLMNGINEVRPEILKAESKFKMPEGVVTRSMCGISGLAPSAECSAAGLVTSDLFNANVFVPTKADDSLTSSSYVQMNGKKYRALPTTPKEFVVSKGGIGVTQDYIDWILRPFGGNAEYLFPNNSSYAQNVISEEKFEADDAAPAAVSLTLTDKKITWTASASKDVIGYYVYSVDGGEKKIATVHDGGSYSHSIGPGSYIVKAVDITGKLSGASNTVTLEKEEEPIEEEPEKPNDPPKNEKPGKPKDPPKNDDKPGKPGKPEQPGKPEDPPGDEDPPGTDPPEDEE